MQKKLVEIYCKFYFKNETIASGTQMNNSLISLKQLEFTLHTSRDDLRSIAKLAGKLYNPYDLHKKGTDKWRHIDNPKNELKKIQRIINKTILKKNIFLLPERMTGGITGKSIIDNAKNHVNKEYILIIDIKDCFPSTDNLKILYIWRTYFGCGNTTARILTQLTTFQTRLPQGAPTSSLLCNFALLPIFRKIDHYASLNNLSFSIFVDDITISGRKNDVIGSIKPIIKILKEYNYAVKKKKIKIFSSGYSQRTTGINVNKKLSVGRRKLNEIRKLIIESAKLEGYMPSTLINKISGDINFIQQISQSDGKKLKELANKLLVAPIKIVRSESDCNTRACKDFKINHKYI